MRTRDVGLAVVALGGGRARASDPIDYRVGLTHVANIGETVGPDRPLAHVHAASESDADRAVAQLLAAVTVGAGEVDAAATVKRRLG